MIDKRHKNVNWQVGDDSGDIGTWERAGIAVLMDIRDELQKLNLVFRCSNFMDIPHTLSKIARNTTKPKRRRKP